MLTICVCHAVYSDSLWVDRVRKSLGAEAEVPRDSAYMRSQVIVRCGGSQVFGVHEPVKLLGKQHELVTHCFGISGH